MKKIFLLILLLFVFSNVFSQAGTNENSFDNQDRFKITISEGKYFYNNEEVSTTDVSYIIKNSCGPDAYWKFQNGKSLGQVGSMMSVSGLIILLAGGGVAIYYVFDDYDTDGMLAVGVPIAAGGLLITLLSVPISIGGSKKKMKAIEMHNNTISTEDLGLNQDINLNFGFNSGGIGMTLRF